MYLFTRTGRLRAGNTRDAMAWAVGITEKVNQITSLNVSLWTPILSPGNGTLVWTTFVEDLTELEDAQAKLGVDDLFVAEVDRGALYSNDQGVDDEIAGLVHGTVDPERRPSYAAVVRSEITPGSFARGIAGGVEIAQRATAIGGLETSFVVSSSGKYGGVAWITGAESLKQLQTSEEKVNADAGFIALVDEVGAAFQPGITTQTIYNRIV